VGAEYDRRPYGERKPSGFLAGRRIHMSSSELQKNRMAFLLPKPSITFSVTSDACSATAVGTSPELSAWVAAAGRRLVLDKVGKSRKVTTAVRRWQLEQIVRR
jgi:hypothetical protein